MEIIKNQKGGIKISYEGYLYTKKATKPTRIRWECSERKAHSCKGAVTTDLQLGDLRCTSTYSHPSSLSVIDASKVKDTMRDMAKKTSDDPSRIMAQAVTDIPMATRLEVGKTETVKRSLRRQRRAVLPAEPKCTGDLTLDDAWKTTGGADPEPMLVHDSGETSKERLLAFASQKGLETLGSGSDWCDRITRCSCM